MYIDNKAYTDDIEAIINRNLPWNQLESKSVLITGASGLIGTCIIDAIQLLNKRKKLNISIFALARNRLNLEERFHDYIGEDGFYVITADVNKTIQLSEKIDYIIHAASNTHPRAYATDPIGSIMTNIVGLNNLLQYANCIKTKRVVFLSSVEIYGRAHAQNDIFDENYCGYIDSNTLRAGYPEGKRAGEALCQAYREKYGMDIVIPRLSRIYGPSVKNDDTKAMSQFISDAVAGKDIVLKSEGLQRFSYTYVSDAVAGIFTVLLKGEDGEAYNIANLDENYSLKEISLFLSSIANTNVIYDLPNQTEKKGFSKSMVAIMNANKLKKLGWTNKYTLQDGLKRTVNILKQLK
ncbi:NAD(P)-dependent oxidoreductase [Selenomonas ruminantium]|uniref:NAD-dependent epimerase/dehydratase family protein n=1 Tax=Selenomonas ruminantium TaxID=971 RepID=UPI0026EB0CFE|nr:NAD-dependent epimerase/dehydratase family protein [Selenomonas ruminantium]